MRCEWLFLFLSGCAAFVEGEDEKHAVDPNLVGPHDGGSGDAALPVSDAAFGTDAPPPCDPLLLPSVNPCVIADGIFVSQSIGILGGLGTQLQPTSSIAEGLALAKAKGKRLYVCAETYVEQVTILEGVSMFGFFACSGGAWKVSASRALVTSTSRTGVRAITINKSTRVEGFSFVSPNATAPAESSFGLVAINAPGLSLVNVTVRAGDGSSGVAGGDAPAVTSAGSIDGSKFVAWRTCSGTSLCPGLSGDAGASACKVNGSVAPPSQQGVTGGLGAMSTKLTCEIAIPAGFTCKAVEPSRTGSSGVRVGAGGTVGATAKAGPDGAPGASGSSGASVGIFSADGYAPSNGAAGANGEPGGGGGGGGPSDTAGGASTGTYFSDSGAGGGAGGCSGSGGGAGGGGGASVAVMLFDSPIAMESCDFIAGHGGDGASGGASSAGTAGGKGGEGWGPSGLGGGGSGGSGGNGGKGGAGGGGSSIALAVRGAVPKQTAVSLLPGLGGISATATGLATGFYAIPW